MLTGVVSASGHMTPSLGRTGAGADAAAAADIGVPGKGCGGKPD